MPYSGGVFLSLPLSLKTSACPPRTNLFDLTPQGLTMSSRAEKGPITRPSDRSRGRVLLIAKDNRVQFVDAFSTRGIDIFSVANGTAAIVSLTRTRPHLVIADASTPGLKIRELAKMLAQSEDGIPLLLVGSDPSTVALRQAAMTEGAFDYFALPAEI